MVQPVRPRLRRATPDRSGRPTGRCGVAVALAGAAVEKIFFAVIGVVVFLYLFLKVGGSFERKFGLLTQHPWATMLAAAAAAIVFGLGGRLVWRRLSGLWHEAKQGGRILSDRRAYVTQVLVPQFLAWCCKLGVVAVLLAAYGMPVGFHTLFSVLGGNTLANVASLTPAASV